MRSNTGRGDLAVKRKIQAFTSTDNRNYYVTGGTYDSDDTEIQFSGTTGFPAFNVDVSALAAATGPGGSVYDIQYKAAGGTTFAGLTLTSGQLMGANVNNTPTAIDKSGTDGWVLTYDSDETAGVKWAANTDANYYVTGGTYSAGEIAFVGTTGFSAFDVTGIPQGTVTSIAIGGNDGIDVDSGSPITSNGTIQLGLSNIPNSSLANSSVSYGGVSLALGGSDATPAFNLSDATAYVGDSALITVGTITTGEWQGDAIANTYVASSSNWNTAYSDHITGAAYSAGTLTLTQQDGGTLTATGIEQGTVTSVAIGGNDGIDVDSGSPITSAGTIQLGLSNIPVAKLASSAVSYGGVSVTLGQTDATPAFDLTDATNYEGTAVKSSGETGGSKFLREDGDGTSSWQIVDTGSATIAGTIATDQIAVGTGTDTIGGSDNFAWNDSTLTLTNTGDTAITLLGDANRSGENSHAMAMRGKWDGTVIGTMMIMSGPDTTNKDDGQLAFYTASAGTQAERMRIDETGNVGIGTSAPNSLLEVVGTNPKIIVDGGGSDDASIELRETANYGGRMYYDGDSGVFMKFTTIDGGTEKIRMAYDRDGNMYLGSADANDATSNPNMFIDEGGKVGIGTTTPAYTLDVRASDYNVALISGAGNGNYPIFHVKDSADISTALFEGNRAGDQSSRISLWHNPASAHEGSHTAITFQMNNDQNVKHTYGQVLSGIDDYTEDTEDGYLAFSQIKAGSLTEGMRINSTGVGIGTTAPAYELDISSADPQIGLTDTNGSTWYLMSQSDAFWVKDVTNSETRLYINSAGKVGIGDSVSSPTEELEVFPNTDAQAIIGRAYIGTGNSSDYAAFGHYDKRADTGGYSLMAKDDGTTYLNAASGTDIKFRINNSDKMILDSSGKVGIGTTAPDSLLQLYGSSSVFLDLTDSDATGINNLDARVNWTYGAGGTNACFIGTDSGESLFKLGTESGFTANLDIMTAGTSRIRVNDTGEVGIGTTAPDEKFHVYDSSITDGAIMKIQDAAASMVFEADHIYSSAETWFGNGQTLNFNAGTTSGATHYGSFMRYMSGSTEVWRATDVGIGIGTATPTTSLHVALSGSSMGANNAISVGAAGDTGMYAYNATQLRFAVGDVDKLRITTSKTQFGSDGSWSPSVLVGTGAANVPSTTNIAFRPLSDDTDTGYTRSADNTLALVAGGTEIMSATSTAVNVTGTFTTSGIATLADASVLASDAAPTADAQIANKKYVDDSVSTETPGGSTTQLQYNNGGAFGGVDDWTWDGTDMTVATGSALVFGDSLRYIEESGDHLYIRNSETGGNIELNAKSNVKWSIDGALKMYLDGDNLTLNGDSTAFSIKDADGTETVRLATASGDEGLLYLRGPTGGNSIYLDGNSDSYINNGANLGIGTVAPATKLDVVGTITAGANSYMSMQDNEVTTSSGHLKVHSADDVNLDAHSGVTNFQYQGTETFRIAAGASSPVILQPKASGFDLAMSAQDGTEVLRLDSANKRIGIGTTSPSTPLEVVTSDGHASIFRGTSSATIASDTTNNNYIRIKNASTTDATTALLGFQTGNGYVGGFIGTEQYDADDGNNVYANLVLGTKAVADSSPNRSMTIEHTGDVGIGTTGPDRKLHVHNASTSVGFKLSNDSTGQGSADGFYIDMGATDAEINNKETGKIAIATANSTRMTIASDGKVGIGTTSPDRLLHLSSAGTTFMKFTSDNSTDFSIGANSTAGFTVYDETDSKYRFNIDGDGLVGINTYSMSDLLTIQGDDNASTQIGAYAYSATDDKTAKIFLNKSANSTAGSHTAVADNDVLGLLAFRGSDGDSFEIGAQIRGQATQDFAAGARGTDLIFSTVDNSTTTLDDRMVILQDGKVGIGTVAPSNTLEVAGVIRGTNYIWQKQDGSPGLLIGNGGDADIYYDGTDMHINPARVGSGVLKIATNTEVTGTLSATAKSFNIEHPLYKDKRLVHGSLEGPEHGIYIRGSIESKEYGCLIELPEYWEAMCDDYTVQLTPHGPYTVYIKEKQKDKVMIACTSKDYKFDYYIVGSRTDETLEVVQDG